MMHTLVLAAILNKQSARHRVLPCRSKPHSIAKNKAVMLLVLALWCGLVASGVGMLVAYSQTPGQILPPPASPMFDDQSHPNAKPWHLIMGVHPRCPCTTAAISELQRLMTRSSDRLTCTVLVFSPTDAPRNWNDTATMRQAGATPGIRLVNDPDGAKMRHLGIHTSGSTVLYDAVGTPCFHGGITVSRGHEGVNLGVESIIAAIHGRKASVTSSPAYGCSITN